MKLPGNIQLIAISFFCLLAGCASINRQPEGVTSRYPDEPWRYYIEQAASLEKSGDYDRAFANLRMAERLQPEDPAIRQRIERFEAMRTRNADKMFQKGLADYRKKDMQAARRHFLSALYYNPAHPRAMTYLHRTNPGWLTSQTYLAEKRESAADIAEKLWNNYELGFLLYYFNEKSSPEDFSPGESVRYPLLDKKLLPRKPVVAIGTVAPPSDVSQELAKAEKLLAAGKYRSARNVIDLVKLYDPDNPTVERLKDEICYQAGRDLKRRKKYIESLEQLSQVTHGYKGVERLIAEVETAMKEQAEAHYRSGVRHFLKEELELAIADWKAALRLNPDHPTASRDLEEATKLLEKLKELE